VKKVTLVNKDLKAQREIKATLANKDLKVSKVKLGRQALKAKKARRVIEVNREFAVNKEMSVREDRKARLERLAPKVIHQLRALIIGLPQIKNRLLKAFLHHKILQT
jgi:hypothetical protein